MSRKIQPVQVITYKKKIVYKKPENKQKNWFHTFWGIFLINILAVVASVATGGVGASVAVGLGLSELAEAVTATTVQALVNFSISTTMDAISHDVTSKNLLMNALFSVTDLGKLGRAYQESKLIKLLNNSNLLSEIGFNEKIKNFYQLQQHLKLRDVILKDQTKMTFKATVSDTELLQSIFLVADSTFKKEIKSLSVDQLKTLMDIERSIYKMNPRLVSTAKKINLKKIDRTLKSELNINLNDFFKLNNLEATNAFIKLQGTNLSQKTLNNLNLMRMQSKFQRNILDFFKEQWKNLKNQSKRYNPFWWADQALQKKIAPLNKGLDEIEQSSKKYFQRIPSLVRKTIKEYKLVACQSNSLLLGYRFEPVGLDGSGYLTLYKKTHSWKTMPKKSLVQPIRIWTNLTEVKEFAFAKNQTQFYLKNWSLNLKVDNVEDLKVLGSRVTKFINEINKFENSIKSTMFLLKPKTMVPIKTVNNIQKVNLLSSQTFHFKDNSPVFTSTLLQSFKNQKWKMSWIPNESTPIIKK